MLHNHWALERAAGSKAVQGTTEHVLHEMDANGGMCCGVQPEDLGTEGTGTVAMVRMSGSVKYLTA